MMTKRIVALVAVLTLVMTMFILPTTAGAIYEAYSCCSNGKPLNVRSGPGKEYERIGSIPYGEMVAVDHDLGNGWSELVWGSVPGYVMTSLLSRTDPGPYRPTPRPQPQPAPSPSGGSSLNNIFKKARFVSPYTVTLRGTRGTGSVNVRWAPSTDSALIQTYAYGSTMQVIAEMGDWSQVVDPVTGLTGFAMSKFLYR
ncbi:MAG: SH3 domain-containing protein [Clostridia bacterium]|nr:SH3 domain-containing protein [Clostridia bacterium]